MTLATCLNKLPYKIRNTPSVTLFRKKLKPLYFKTFLKTARRSHLVCSGSLLGFDTARYGDFEFDQHFGISQPLLKSDTRNKIVQNQLFIINQE